MKKAMISQPMAGFTDEEIVATREKAKKFLEDNDYEFVNTLFSDEWYSKEAMEERGVVQIPLCFLAKSLENMSLCHAAYFCKGWEKARGCRIEHEAAKQYGVEIIYESVSPRKQILTGADFWRAVQALNLESAQELYFNNLRVHITGNPDMRIWELSEDDFNKISHISDEDWRDSWSWWRSSEGSNFGKDRQFQTIKVAEEWISAWYDKEDLESYIEDMKEDEVTEEELKADFLRELTFTDLFDYSCRCLHLSNMKNFWPVCVDLAKMNDMTPAELFNKYM